MKIQVNFILENSSEFFGEFLNFAPSMYFRADLSTIRDDFVFDT